MGPSLQAEINRGITSRFCITRSPLGGPGPSAQPRGGGEGGRGGVRGRRAGEKKKRLTHGHSHTHTAHGGRVGEGALIPSKTEKLAINLFRAVRPGSFSTCSPDCRLVLQHLVQNSRQGRAAATSDGRSRQGKSSPPSVLPCPREISLVRCEK